MKLWCPLSQLVNEGFSPNHNFFAKNFIMHLWPSQKDYLCMPACTWRENHTLCTHRCSYEVTNMLPHTHARVYTYQHTSTHMYIQTHTWAVFAFSHRHSDAAVGGNNCHFAGRGLCSFSLKRRNTCLRSLWMSGAHTGSPPCFVDVSLAPSPLLGVVKPTFCKW